MIWKRRYSVLIVLFCTYLLCYVDRMAIATAIPFIADDLHLTPLAMGSVLSAFFMGYAAMQIPGGLLADKLGPNRVMTSCISGWSVFTALTGTAGSLTALLVIRVLFGVCEGPFAPTASKAVAIWFPQAEVGRANGVQLAAVNIGAAIAPILVAQVIVTWGWRSVFYSLLVPGLIMTFLVRVSIKDSPCVGESDKRAATSGAVNAALGRALKTPSVLWCSVTLFLTNIATWGLMNWIPTYLLRARDFTIVRVGMFAPLPYLAGAAGYYLGGHISDKYFSGRRRIPILAGLILGGVATYLVAIAPSGEWAVAALMLAFLFLFISLAGIFTLPLVMVSQEAVGATFGLVNTVGQIAAFLSPLAVGYVLSVNHGNFTIALYCFVGLFAAAACAATKLSELGLAQGPRIG